MIDYGRLDRSTAYYEKAGFSRIEAPWTVTAEIANITKPEGKSNWEILGKNKVLVASGEQSFLYLYLKNFLPKGKYQTITPCFRDEPFDKTHTKYFMKNELIITDTVNFHELEQITHLCLRFFEQELKLNDSVKIVTTAEGYDLVTTQGIELGSYGIRTCEYLSWIYATGLAEPRMTIARNISHGIS